jgi:LacI family transcriptional regulator
MLLKRRIDGFLFVPVDNNADPIKLIQQQNIEVVVLDRDLPDAIVDVVRGDSLGGAYQLTQHLIELGHKHIAILTGPKNISTAEERVAGFRQAVKEAGLDHNLENVYWGTFHKTTGSNLAEIALTSTPRPTALVTANNFIATGTLQTLSKLGLRVPDDISLVTFDDFPAAINPAQFLTVAIQPAYEMGYQAANLLLDRLLNDEPREQQKIILPTEISIRQSTAAPL